VKEMVMAEPAANLLIKTPSGAVRPNATSGARWPASPARLRRRAEAPPEPRGAEPGTADDGTDYTGFSMVGIAG